MIKNLGKSEQEISLLRQGEKKSMEVDCSNDLDTMKRLDRKIEKILERDMFKTLVYWKESKPIGYLIFTIFPKRLEAFILNIYIEEKNKENGFENKLVEALKLESEVKKISVNINPKKVNLLNIFAQLGFETVKHTLEFEN